MISPVAFSWGPVTVYWYGLLVALAFLGGVLVTYYYARIYGLDFNKMDALLLRVILAIIVGARLGYVVTRWEHFAAQPLRILRIDRGGLGSHGGILLALVLGYFWCRRLELPFGRTLDAVAPALPLGHIFVRLGNFINGELYGAVTELPWAVTFPGVPGPRHPVQIYEILLSLLLLLLVPRLVRRRRFDGYVFLYVLLLQSLIRFGLDFLRRFTPPIGPFVLTQIVALVLAAGSAGVLWHRYRSTDLPPGESTTGE